MNYILSGALVSLGLLLGRLLGFVRELIIASSYGASESSDVIVVLLTAPDILINLLVGGAFGMVMIPEFSSGNQKRAKALFNQAFLAVLIIFLVITIFFIVISEYLFTLLMSGLVYEKVKVYDSFLDIVLLSIPLTVLAGLSTSYLHYRGKFLLPAFGTPIFNLSIIAGLLFSVGSDYFTALYIVCTAVLVGSFIRLLSQVYSVNTWMIGLSNQILITKGLIVRYLQCLLTTSLIILVPVFVRSISSSYGEGYLSVVNYSIKLIEFPLGVFLTVFSVIFLPKLSSEFSENSTKGFEGTLKNIVFLVLLVSMSLTSVLYAFSEEVISIVYGWGKLTEHQLRLINSCFLVLILALPFQAYNSIIISALAARKDTYSSLLVTTPMVMVFIVIAKEYSENIEGLLWGIVILYSIVALFLTLCLKIRHKVSFIFTLNQLPRLLKIMVFISVFNLVLYAVDGYVVSSLARILLVSAVICMFLYFSFYMFRDLWGFLLSKKEERS